MFGAKRSDAKWCPACRPEIIRETNRKRPPQKGHAYVPVDLSVLVCKGCGATFEAKRNDAKWCLECRTTGKDGRLLRFETMRRHPCIDCGLPCHRKSVRCHKCANKERGLRLRGEIHPSWKGGRTKHSDGYWELRIDGEKILEHRYVWEQAHGPIPSNIHIHHANGDKADNRLENLVATDAQGHRHRQRMVEPYADKVQQLEARIRELEQQVFPT